MDRNKQMKNLPFHEHRSGCTEREVRKHFEKVLWDGFSAWIDGHTCVILEDGTPLFNSWDVAHFLEDVLSKDRT